MGIVITAAVHTESKSRFHPSRVARAIADVAAATVGTETTITAFCDELPVALVRGKSGSRRVLVRPVTRRQWCGFDSYADMSDEVRRGKHVDVIFNKDPSAWARANTWGDYWPVGGVPGAGDYAGAAATCRFYDQTTAGAFDIRLKTPAGGETRHAIMQYAANRAAQNVGQIRWVYDRTIGYDGCTISTTTTTVINSAPATRHISAGDDGLQIMITSATALGATASNLSTITFNDNLATGNDLSLVGYTPAWFASAPAGSSTAMAPIVCPHDNVNGYSIAPWLPMPPGVAGMRNLIDFTSSANNTGTVCIAGIRPLFAMWTNGSQAAMWLDHARSMMMLPRIYDSACMNMIGKSHHNSGSNAVANYGIIRVAHS